MAENPEDLIVTDAELRRQLPALAKELKIGSGVEGSVPIFATLAEAEAWEAKNPGKAALTLEPSTPDTTAPSAGVLTVTKTHNSAVLSVSGATDDRAVTGYAFQVGATGGWSVWQTAPSYEASGLTPSTSYQFRHKVRDAAGNEAVGAPVTVTTDAKPPIQAGDVITSDAFTFFADGTLINGKATDCTLGGEPLTYKTVGVGADTGIQAQGGEALFTGPTASNHELTLTHPRVDREMSIRVTAIPSSGSAWVVVRDTGAAKLILRIDSNGGGASILQGPGRGVVGPALPAGTVKVGSIVTAGAKGDAWYALVDGANRIEHSAVGNTGTMLSIRGPQGFKFDDLVVKAL